jgi:hypothetical protein
MSESLAAIDFQKIRSDSIKQCERICELREELSKLLRDDPGVSNLPLRNPTQQHGHPHLLSRMDRIQSRLSLLASTLSPSNRSTPVNKLIPGESPSRKLCIHTPAEIAYSEEADILLESSKDKIASGLKSLENAIDSKISALQNVRNALAETNARVVAQMNERERILLAALVDGLQTVDSGNSDSLHLNDLLKEEAERLRLGNAQCLSSSLMKELNDPVLRDSLQILEANLQQYKIDESDDFRNVSERWGSALHHSIQELRDRCLFDLSRIRMTLEDMDSHGGLYEEMQTLVKENSDLRRRLRKSKLAFSKWMADFVEARPAIDTPCVVPSHEGLSFSVGENFQSLLQTLARMWAALPPSGTECVELLSRVQRAVEMRGAISLADVIKDECNRQVEKLPIAELAARRELLITKGISTPQDHLELRTLTDNLSSLIREYEKKHQQRFMYEGEEYLFKI